ncbi:hypothetical protein [Microbacterium sp. NPDC090003]|jgi:hypothetical protein|uniref:hypothetical protein n=1 Tax=Microbacterium sp. NPDC090003 TaxID=3364203 RepID=UPI00381E7641
MSRFANKTITLKQEYVLLLVAVMVSFVGGALAIWGAPWNGLPFSIGNVVGFAMVASALTIAVLLKPQDGTRWGWLVVLITAAGGAWTATRGVGSVIGIGAAICIVLPIILVKQYRRNATRPPEHSDDPR